MHSPVWRGIALAFVLSLISAPAFAQAPATDAPAAVAPAAATPEATTTAPATATPEGAIAPEQESPSQPPPPDSAEAAPAPAAGASAAPAGGSPLPDIDRLIHVPDAAKAAPGQKLDVEAATQAYLAELPAEARARSDAYFEGGYILILVDFLYAALLAAILMWSRLSANLRDRAQRITSWRWLQSGIYALQYLIVATILGLPLAIYEGWYREREFGLSNQTLPEWFTDYGIAFGLQLPILIVFFIVLYALIRWTQQRWWIWATALAVLFIAFQALIFPVYLAPALNKYTPLAQGELRDSILSMARANGVPADNVWQFDASKQHKRISANVSGFMGTTRVSLNDNLLKRGSLPEVKAVMGHELGHYVLNHSWKFLVTFALLLLIAFGFTNWAYNGLVRRFGERWRVSGIDDPAGLPVIFALLAFLGFAGTPVLNTMVRSAEAEADIFGLNAAREPDGFAMTALKLSEYRKLDPQPWEEFIFYDHPSGRARIHMSMQWKAEHLNGGDGAGAGTSP